MRILNDLTEATTKIISAKKERGRVQAVRNDFASLAKHHPDHAKADKFKAVVTAIDAALPDIVNDVPVPKTEAAPVAAK